MTQPPSSTRDALLHTARRLFARGGYDGTSIRAITDAADVNLGAVTYHFGSKQALYGAVLESALDPLVQRIRGVASEGPADGLDRTGAVIRILFDHLGRHPDLPHLMLQEIASGRPPPEAVRRLLGAVMETVARALERGQEAGTVREGEPLLLAISSVIQPLHFNLVRRWLDSVVGIDLGEEDDRARVVEHSVAFARAGLRLPDPPDPGPDPESAP